MTEKCRNAVLKSYKICFFAEKMHSEKRYNTLEAPDERYCSTKIDLIEIYTQKNEPHFRGTIARQIIDLNIYFSAPIFQNYKNVSIFCFSGATL
jgi:hypothetical protein